LIQEIQSLLGRHGVGPEALAGALEEALFDIGATGKERDALPEEIRSCLLGLVLSKIFARGSVLWISLRTDTGIAVSPDLLVTAHALWAKALHLAARYGVDAAAAAEALAGATHTTAEELAGSGGVREARKIRDVRNYLFATYMYTIFGIAGRQGSIHTLHLDTEDLDTNGLSDKGAFLEVLERGIYCREFLAAMPPKGRSVAIARYILGYSWPETARALGCSINTAQKALSTGVRKAFATCMQDLRRARHRTLVEIEIGKKKARRARAEG
jgi:DNA-directed RNA polymerase specialized sigma24 family protein